MTKIDKIRIQNFKAFPELETFELGGKNLLVFGNNGSGKSSLYWALYTFLQSSEKRAEDINKYFIPFDEANENTYQSLRNIYRPEADDSFIEIEFQGEAPARLAQNDIVNTQTPDIKEANKASDFINYKLLHNFYNSTHKKHLNVWEVFRRDFFPYFQYGGKSYSNWLEEISNSLPKYLNGRFFRRDSWMYNDFQGKIGRFNSEISALLDGINHQANRVLEDKFRVSDIKINLEYLESLAWDKDHDRLFNNPEIKLSVKYFKDGSNTYTNHRPQSFLNEASLTRIAISIRLGALLTRLADSERKILVLDDMLLSLDMSNRMIVSEIILNDDDLSDFQKIILTHDRGFFNILRSATSSTEWNYLTFEKDENNLASRPNVKSALTDFEKAKQFFENHEHEACANFIRKEAENILKKYLGKSLSTEFETLSNMIGRVKNAIEGDRLHRFDSLLKNGGALPLEKLREDFENDDTLAPEIKGKLRTFRHNLFNFLTSESPRRVELTEKLGELARIKDRILNPHSHGTFMPCYESELKDAIKIIEELHVLLNPNPAV